MTSGCSSILNTHIEYETIAPEQYPVLTSVGYAPISAQPGETKEQQMLNAMTASKLAAYQELAEQLYGMAISSRVGMQNLVLDEQYSQAHIQGLVQGAKVVSVYPVDADTYATELSLDTRRLNDLRTLTTQPKRVKEITYY
jgi:hypothetical protein